MTRIDRRRTPSYVHEDEPYTAINREIEGYERAGYTILSVQIISENYNPPSDYPHSMSYVLTYRKSEEDAFA